MSESAATDRHQFARSVQEAIARRAPAQVPAYDERLFCLVQRQPQGGHTIDQQMYLERAFARYRPVGGSKAGAAIVEETAQQWLALAGCAAQSESVERDRLVPLVRSRLQFEIPRLELDLRQESCETAGLLPFAFRVLAEHFAVTVAEDQPSAYRYLTDGDLTRCGLTFDEALRVAQANLRRLDEPGGGPRFELLEEAFWCPTRDMSERNSALLFEVDEIRRLPVQGQHVAFVPTSHMIWISGSEQHDAVRLLAKMTAEEVRSGQGTAICPVPLILDERGQWKPWLPMPLHPLYWTIRELHVRHEFAACSRQRELLRAGLERRGDERTFVADYKVVPASDPHGQERLYSFAVWTETLPTLLPKVDFVALRQLLNRDDLDRGQSTEPVFGETVFLPWEDVARYLGHRLKPQDLYPERYRAVDFPTGDAWKRLAAHQARMPRDFLAAIHQSTSAPPPQKPAVPATSKGAPPAAPSTSHYGLLWVLLLTGGVLCVGGGGLTLALLAIRLPSFTRPAQPLPGPVVMSVPTDEGPGPTFVDDQVWEPLQAFAPLPPRDEALPRLSFDPDELVLSGRAGRASETRFDDRAPAGGWLVGFRILRGQSWGGAIRSLQPIYQVEDQLVAGLQCGRSDAVNQTEVLARPGYAVGAIQLRGGMVLNAVQIRFQKVDGQRLDGNETYETDWYGCPGGSLLPALDGDGEPLVGIGGTFRDDLMTLQVCRLLRLPQVEQEVPLFDGELIQGERAGGAGGTPLLARAPANGLLVGLRVFQGESWGGAVQAIQPIYQAGDRYLLGTCQGREGGTVNQLLAPPGYAIGALRVNAGMVVNAVELTYYRVGPDRLLPEDARTARRVGVDGGDPVWLDGQGRPVVGIFGSFGHDLQSLGLLLLAGKPEGRADAPGANRDD